MIAAFMAYPHYVRHVVLAFFIGTVACGLLGYPAMIAGGLWYFVREGVTSRFKDKRGWMDPMVTTGIAQGLLLASLYARDFIR